MPDYLWYKNYLFQYFEDYGTGLNYKNKNRIYNESIIMTIWITVAILSFCAIVQGAAGFAYSLFALPLLLITGYDFPNAVALTLLASLVQRLTMVSKLRNAIPWRDLLLPTIFIFLFIPFGVLTLRILGHSASGMVKRIIGVLVVTVLLIRWLVKIKPRDKVPWGWGALAGSLAGFFQGLANIGGPPLVLWSMAHCWSPEKLRIVTPMLTILVSPFQIFMLNVSLGSEIWPSFKIMAIVVPVVILSTFAGVWLGGHLKVERLRMFITILLIVLSFYLIFNPLALLK